MNLSNKELRKLLNNAWDDACWWRNMFALSPDKSARQTRRYRDVSKIIKEAMPKPQAWDNLTEEEQP